MPLPRRQLQKADAILTAYLDDAEIWAEVLPDVAALLRAGHLHDLISTGQVRSGPTIEEAAATSIPGHGQPRRRPLIR
jgi:hypothetical protein